MPIEQLTVQNFKGIGEATTFAVRPITVFLGANSSGKSSAIHALMSLAQTLKLGNSAPALVLDDDFAHVHLGRFVEIAHSHSYSDAISLGIDIGNRTFQLATGAKKVDPVIEATGVVRAAYNFRSTLRTQEVYVDSARLSIGDRALLIKRGTKAPYKFSTTDETGKRRYETARSGNFLFQIRPTGLNVAGADARELLEDFWLLDLLQRELERELRQTRYLGPFRQSPLRRYPFRGATAAEVGAQGEATITLLASEYVQSQERIHAKQINQWLGVLGLAKSVELARVGTSDLFDVSLKLADGEKLPIADLGYGLSQVLPVLTQCSFAPKNSTLLFEQPELHLHENAAKKLAHVFHDTAMQKSARVVLETHSKELVYEIFELVKAGKLKTDDLAIYVVERAKGASAYKRLSVDWDEKHLEVDDPWVSALTKR